MSTIKDKIKAAAKSGVHYSDIAKTLNISRGQVASVIFHLRKKGELPPIQDRSAYINSITGYVETRPARTCQFIPGVPSPNDACKCGEPVREGSPYCPTHHAICHKPAEKPSESEAA